MNENKSDLPEKDRWNAIDELRGFAVLLLFAFNGFHSYSNAPAWLDHAPIGKYFIFDLVAPLFLFAVGLSYSLSFKKRSERDGKTSAVLNVFRRNLLLIFFGTVGGWLINWKLSFYWGTLEMIGLCGIAALPFLTLSPARRIFMALWLVVMWQLLLGVPGMTEIIGVRYTMGGPASVISWMSALLIASAFSDWKNSLRKSEYFSGVLTVILILHLLMVAERNFFVINKLIVNAPYILYSLQLALTTFFFFYLKEQYGFQPLPVLKTLGKNALVLYMTSGVTDRIFLAWLGADTSLPQLTIVAICQILLNIGIAVYLDRNKIYISL